MRQLYPEWDGLNDITKRTLIRQETIAMQQAKTLARQQEIDDRQRLEDELDNVIENSDYAKKPQGREADFKRFARSPKNRGIAAEVLAKAFLFDAEDDSTALTPLAPKHTGLPSGNGGPREPLKPKKITLEEAREIRKTDYRRYLGLVKAGQIEDDI